MVLFLNEIFHLFPITLFKFFMFNTGLTGQWKWMKTAKQIFTEFDWNFSCWYHQNMLQPLVSMSSLSDWCDGKVETWMWVRFMEPNRHMNFIFPSVIYLIDCQGNSANAVPHYQKLYSRVNRVWINRKGQPSRCAMARPHPGGTTFMIMVASELGKYAVDCLFTSSHPNRQVVPTLALPEWKWHAIPLTIPVSIKKCHQILTHQNKIYQVHQNRMVNGIESKEW